MEDAEGFAAGGGDDERGDLAGLHDVEGFAGEGLGRDGDRVGVHDVGGGAGEGFVAVALEEAAEVAVGDHAEEFAGWGGFRGRLRLQIPGLRIETGGTHFCGYFETGGTRVCGGFEDGGHAEFLVGHLMDDVGEWGLGGDGGEVRAGVHEVADAGEAAAEAATGVELGEVFRLEAAAAADLEGEGVAEGEHDGGGGGGGKVEGAGLGGDGGVEGKDGGLGEGGGGFAAEGDDLVAEVLEGGQEGEDLLGLAGGG